MKILHNIKSAYLKFFVLHITEECENASNECKQTRHPSQGKGPAKVPFFRIMNCVLVGIDANSD